jgi:hypothetical protein
MISHQLQNARYVGRSGRMSFTPPQKGSAPLWEAHSIPLQVENHECTRMDTNHGNHGWTRIHTDGRAAAGLPVQGHCSRVQRGQVFPAWESMPMSYPPRSYKSHESHTSQSYSDHEVGNHGWTRIHTDGDAPHQQILPQRPFPSALIILTPKKFVSIGVHSWFKFCHRF